MLQNTNRAFGDKVQGQIYIKFDLNALYFLLLHQLMQENVHI